MSAALASLVLRIRAASEVERQQLRWVAPGATTAVAGLLATNLLYGTAPVAVIIFALAVPLCSLRGRGWRCCGTGCGNSTGWSAVLLPTRPSPPLLVVPYLLIVPAASRLVEGSGSPAVAAATLAAAFQP